MCEQCGVGRGLAAAGLARLQEECGDNIGRKAKLSRDVGLSGETRKDGVGGVACWGPLFAQLVGSEMGLGKMNQIEAEDLSVLLAKYETLLPRNPVWLLHPKAALGKLPQRMPRASESLSLSDTSCNGKFRMSGAVAEEGLDSVVSTCLDPLPKEDITSPLSYEAPLPHLLPDPCCLLLLSYSDFL